MRGQRPNLAEFLQKLKRKERKLFLVTNSPYYFVDAGMTYMLGKEWRDLFDIIVVSADKVRSILQIRSDSSKLRQSINARHPQITYSYIRSGQNRPDQVPVRSGQVRSGWSGEVALLP